MKKILFVMHSANIGGPVTSLLNINEMLKECGIEIDIFLMSHVGEFIESYKKNANILPESRLLSAAICRKEDVKKHYGVPGLLVRLPVVIGNRLHTTCVNNAIYKVVARKLSGYDVVIGYQETTVTNFSRFIKASMKIAWVHSIFDKFSCKYNSLKEIQNVYNQFDKIVCVAESASKTFKVGLPSMSEKVRVINNPVSSKRIYEKSKESYNFEQQDIYKDGYFLFVSVGRLSPEKQYDMAVEVAARAKALEKKFIWIIVGDGSEKPKLQKKIDEYSLEKTVILTGYLVNPYPLIRKADALIITSLYEAQPMVALEALILNTPVITTNYTAAYDLVKHGKNGLICENSIEGVLNSIINFMDDKNLTKVLKQGANSYLYRNDEIKDLLLNLIEEE